MTRSIILLGALGCIAVLVSCGGSDSPEASENGIMLDINGSAPTAANGMDSSGGAHSSNDDCVRDLFGVSLARILSPISQEMPAGRDLRTTSVYAAIRNARSEEDPSLPLGAWERELKRAQWSEVSNMALRALLQDSKDLQLAAWLLEAQIHVQGFKALKPCFIIIRNLYQAYWDKLYPADLEQRDNIFRWIAEKLLPPLRSTPITARTADSAAYVWADWEQARRNEQIQAALAASGKQAEQSIEGATFAELNAAMSATSTNFFEELLRDFTGALQELSDLESALYELCGDEAPQFGALRQLLGTIRDLVSQELRRR